jgi:hypothetical protein
MVTIERTVVALFFNWILSESQYELQFIVYCLWCVTVTVAQLIILQCKMAVAAIYFLKSMVLGFANPASKYSICNIFRCIYYNTQHLF